MKTHYHVLASGQAIKLSTKKEVRNKLNLSSVLMQNESPRKLGGNRGLNLKTILK